MKKIKPIKNTWYNWLTNYISKPVRKSVDGCKDKIVSLFKTNTLRKPSWERKETKQTKNTENIRKPFI